MQQEKGIMPQVEGVVFLTTMVFMASVFFKVWSIEKTVAHSSISTLLQNCMSQFCEHNRFAHIRTVL